MRTWKIIGRYPIYNTNGVIESTEVHMVSESGRDAILESIPGDMRYQDELTLIKTVKEQFHKSEFADYAVSEAVVKVDDLDNKVKEFDALMTKVRNDFEEIQNHYAQTTQQLAENENVRNGMFTNMVNTLNEHNKDYTLFKQIVNEFMLEYYENNPDEEVEEDESTEGHAEGDTSGETEKLVEGSETVSSEESE